MNAVQDFLRDQVRVEETLVINSEIRTRKGYLVDTTGPTWPTPPGGTNFYWSKFKELGAFSRTLQAYAAALLGGKSVSYSKNFNSACTNVASFGGWQVVASEWITRGEISFESMLRLKQGLFERNAKAGKNDFLNIRRWYEWAHGLRIPGFTDETWDRLADMNLGGDISFLTRQRLVPGAPKSRTSKNRQVYTEVDFSRIQATLLRLEGRLNSGEIILSTGTDFSSLPKKYQNLAREQGIGIRHLVLGWLNCLYGERPESLCMLRESSFEFYEVDGLQVGSVVFSGEVKRRYGRLRTAAKRPPLPLNAELVRLIPKLMEENRAWASKHEFGLDIDLPLFHVIGLSKLGPMKKANDDVATMLTREPFSLIQDLKALFLVLKVRYSDGTLINPTFNSHRDGNTTRWTRSMPLESVAEIHGKKGIQSLKHYVRPGIRHVATLDSVPEYTELAGQLKSPVPTETIDPRARIPAPFPYVSDGEGKLRVGVEGGCGCFGSACPMAFDGTVDCYVCHAFTPAVEGPHDWTLKVLIDKKASMIERGAPRSEWTRYDERIAAVGEVIRLVQEYWRERKMEKPE